jgi:hypothetical protein
MRVDQLDPRQPGAAEADGLVDLERTKTMMSGSDGGRQHECDETDQPSKHVGLS